MIGLSAKAMRIFPIKEFGQLSITEEAEQQSVMEIEQNQMDEIDSVNLEQIRKDAEIVIE